MDWNAEMHFDHEVTLPCIEEDGNFKVKPGETPARAAIRTLIELRRTIIKLHKENDALAGRVRSFDIEREKFCSANVDLQARIDEMCEGMLNAADHGKNMQDERDEANKRLEEAIALLREPGLKDWTARKIKLLGYPFWS